MASHETTNRPAPETFRTLPDALLTVGDVAFRLRVDETTVRRWIKQGTLEAFSLPHTGKRQSYRVRLRTIETLLKQPAFPA